MELAFITDLVLRQRIEGSVEYIYALYENTKSNEERTLYHTETYRVIILYTVSIIEAVLFYIYEKKNFEICKTEYKDIVHLPESYKNINSANKSSDGRVVIALEKISSKKESEIALKELVEFLTIKKVLKKETEQELLKIIKTRNSVHLRQSTRHNSTIADVDASLDLLVYVLTNAIRFS